MAAFELHPLMQQLAAHRPCFHSEKDFQHAFAWEVQRRWPASVIRLERRPPQTAERIYIDIWVTLDGQVHAIELKYKTRKAQLTHAAEEFALMNHGAHDLGRYDFLKDISRLERIASTQPIRGHAVLLTNDSAYWRETGSGQSIDAAFRLHDGRTIAGNLAWGSQAGAGTTAEREASITIGGHYVLQWCDYSQLASSPTGLFRFLAVSFAALPSGL
jgi:hypothetical protein